MSKLKRYDLRQILNSVKWTSGNALEEVVVEFVSRGEPEDRGRIEGAEILGIGAGGIETATRMVPYHRINRILRNGKTIFERP